MPWGYSEYDYAGGLRNKPVEVVRGKTTDLPIPAGAEIVLEGEILPPGVDDRLEGPFGEYTGYYASGARNEPAFKVKCVMHRNDPIITGHPPRSVSIIWNADHLLMPPVYGTNWINMSRA